MSEHENDEIWRINLLLEESRGERYNDPARMVYLAELGRAASEHLDPGCLGEARVADIPCGSLGGTARRPLPASPEWGRANCRSTRRAKNYRSSLRLRRYSRCSA